MTSPYKTCRNCGVVWSTIDDWRSRTTFHAFWIVPGEIDQEMRNCVCRSTSADERVEGRMKTAQIMYVGYGDRGLAISVGYGSNRVEAEAEHTDSAKRSEIEGRPVREVVGYMRGESGEWVEFDRMSVFRGPF